MATMEVLLREDVENLGRRGQVVRVRAGYARNYLLPRKLAMVATSANVKVIERERRMLERREVREKAVAQSLAERLQGVALEFVRKASEQGVLYGSVTTHDIAETLTAQGIEIERRKILMAGPIKEPGEYTVPVKLHRDVVIQIKVAVRKEGAEGEGEAPKAEAVERAAETAVEAAEPASAEPVDAVEAAPAEQVDEET
jgi:large subunit ribosomal protein L9